MSASNFYRAFEDRYRGSRELIRSRLQVYNPFIAPLLELHHPAAAIDLGCGRGEWLELLQDTGFQAHGVDMDAGMLASCVQRGLSVSQEDAVTHLRQLDDESQSIVSGFHLVEHVPFHVLETLVAEALRVLRPGGLLILETPNPENLVVGTHSFYLDPTHQRPIPPLLLAFVVSHMGFERLHTLRLQEAPDLHEDVQVSLMTVLEGVSPDYAVVAQKTGPAELMNPLNSAFSAPYGITLHELAGRYDDQIKQRFAGFKQSVSGLDQHFSALEQRLEAFMSQTKQQLDAANHAAQMHMAQTSEAMKAMSASLNAAQTECNALRESWSWRVTAPLRMAASPALRIVKPLRNAANFTIRHGIEVFHRPLSRLMSLVLRDTERSDRLNHWLMKHVPALHGQLRAVARRADLVPERYVESIEADTPVTFNSLSTRAREIHSHIQTAFGDPH